MSNDNKTTQTPQTAQIQQPQQAPSTVFAEEKTTSRRVEPIYVKPSRQGEE